jgi:hypothetical protein
MSTIRFKGIMAAALLGLLAAHSNAASADPPSGQKSLNGVTIHLGVKPVAELRRHPELLPQGHPLPSGEHMHHVLVAVFDKATGERITDAEVDARVSPLGLAGPKRSMHPEALAGQVTFCNFFRMSPGETYVIRVEVRQLGAPSVATVKFMRSVPWANGGTASISGPGAGART